MIQIPGIPMGNEQSHNTPFWHSSAARPPSNTSQNPHKHITLTKTPYHTKTQAKGHSPPGASWRTASPCAQRKTRAWHCAGQRPTPSTCGARGGLETSGRSTPGWPWSWWASWIREPSSARHRTGAPRAGGLHPWSRDLCAIVSFQRGHGYFISNTVLVS